MKNYIRFTFLTVLIIITFLCSINFINVNAAEKFPFNGTIDSYLLDFHNAPNTSSSSTIEELAYGTKVKVLGKEGSMYKVEYNGQIGYLYSSYVVNLDNVRLSTDVNGIEKYEDYCSTLVNEGFDESYCPYLYYMHSKHPKWVFKADKLNITLEEASKAEESRCSLQTYNQKYWLNGGIDECPASGTCWYWVKADVIASFMDPRNGLYENKIFQFLDSDANKDIFSDEAINNLVGSGNLKQYIPFFKKAASVQGINVMQLISRSKLEGNNTVGYGPSSGIYTDKYKVTYNGKTLNGFYNFYNIGAYKANGLDPQARAVAYAAGYLDGNSYNRPWTTPELAIVNGAAFIAEQYVKQGQDTPYYQKFNIASYNKISDYNHQYMTSINAPIEEATSTRSTYEKANSLDLGFVFTIPVFKNMKSEAYESLNKSNDSTLKAITIDGKNITNFDSIVTEYNYNASTKNDTIKVDATTNIVASKVTGTGEYKFTDNKVVVTLIVTAEDGSQTTYTINVTRINPEDNVSYKDIVSKMGVKVNDKFMYGISPGTSVSSLTNTVTKNNGTVKITSASGAVKNSGSLATGDKITINGTTDSITYTISVRGDTNSDGIVDLKDFVLVQSHILKKNNLSNEYFYAADVNYDGNIALSDFVLIQSHILKKVNL